jgi:large subunit ribosomal protein L9
MKLILTQDVYKHGVAGEVVTVADGFARNWLIPQGMALPASKANLSQMENLRQKAAENRSVYNDKVNAAARQIDGVELVFGMKAGSNNKLYGSITSQMIKDELLKKTNLDINRRRISDKSIRELGRYDVPVRMGDVSPVLKIVVVREDEVAAYLNGGVTAEAEPVEAAQDVQAQDAEAAVPAEQPADDASAEVAAE